MFGDYFSACFGRHTWRCNHLCAPRLHQRTAIRFLLVTDFRSAIPVQDVRSDAKGILIGRGRFAKLVLKDIPGTMDVKVNDLLVTSGLGGHYPPGYPVGLVSAVHTNVATQFANIEVDPSAQLNLHRPVLLVWPNASSTTTVKKSVSINHHLQK